MNLEVGFKNKAEDVGLKALRTVSVLSPWKIYRGDPLEDFAIDPFTEMVRGTETKFTRTNSGFYLEYQANGLAKKTQAFTDRAFLRGIPTIIFHHGAGEINDQSKLDLLFGRRDQRKVNLIVIKAADHQSKGQFLREGFKTLASQQAVFAGSVLMEQFLVDWIHSNRLKALVTGTSMGGIVASWHWLLYGSADFYLPVTAYPNVAEIFLGEGYQGATDHRIERQKLEAYQKAFAANLKDAKGSVEQIKVILGEADKIVGFKRAREFWQGVEVETYPYGHATPFFKGKEIGREILNRAYSLR